MLWLGILSGATGLGALRGLSGSDPPGGAAGSRGEVSRPLLEHLASPVVVNSLRDRSKCVGTRVVPWTSTGAYWVLGPPIQSTPWRRLLPYLPALRRGQLFAAMDSQSSILVALQQSGVHSSFSFKVGCVAGRLSLSHPKMDAPSKFLKHSRLPSSLVFGSSESRVW